MSKYCHSDEGRPLRILVEYLRPLQAFRSERVHNVHEPEDAENPLFIKSRRSTEREVDTEG